jgi:hypothetical protein
MLAAYETSDHAITSCMDVHPADASLGRRAGHRVTEREFTDGDRVDEAGAAPINTTDVW